MSNLRREALKRVLNALQGGSKPSEKVLERVLDDIAKEAPIVPRNIGTKLESPFTGGAIKDVRLVRGVPHTTEYSTVIVPHDPSKKIRAERRQVTHRPQWQTEGWDSELQNWDLLETHYPAGYKDPIYGIANKISGNVDALEALARYTSAAAGKDVDLARY
ncbi:MAG: hypothetical protein FJW69_09745, partial [Actinobacteria bacterium]|nr:hypothetical protein [Actinomycetota bacterium]